MMVSGLNLKANKCLPLHSTWKDMVPYCLHSRVYIISEFTQGVFMKMNSPRKIYIKSNFGIKRSTRKFKSLKRYSGVFAIPYRSKNTNKRQELKKKRKALHLLVFYYLTPTSKHVLYEQWNQNVIITKIKFSKIFLMQDFYSFFILHFYSNYCYVFMQNFT